MFIRLIIEYNIQNFLYLKAIKTDLNIDIYRILMQHRSSISLIIYFIIS